ncbi:MAG: S8 family serine peptidase [Pseudomonadota bacterium]
MSKDTGRDTADTSLLGSLFLASTAPAPGSSAETVTITDAVASGDEFVVSALPSGATAAGAIGAAAAIETPAEADAEAVQASESEDESSAVRYGLAGAPLATGPVFSATPDAGGLDLSSVFLGAIEIADRSGQMLLPGGSDDAPSAQSMTDSDRTPVTTSDVFEIALDFVPSDTLYGEQWHLNNTGQSGGTPGIDINVEEVWDDYSGAGVTVGIWDDGVEYTHADLNDNYDTSLHITVGGLLHDPFPQSTQSAHGTAVAGLIASENDGVGTVGVAFGASIAGVDMFFDPSLNFNASFGELETFDVTNHSWGFTTPYAANILDVAGWGSFFDGWLESVGTGRGGLGTINVKSAGNDRTISRDTNDSNLTSLPQVIAVAAVSHDDNVSFYSTPGASVLIAAPSNGAAGAGMWTTDRVGSNGYSNGFNEPGNGDAAYTSTFGGTSSAAPVTAGVIALMLEANPNLGWRDVQEILAYSAVHVGSDIGVGPSGNEIYTWTYNGATNWNGGGLHFSNDYGFGMVDAHAAVRLAETWTEQKTSANWVTIVADTASPAAPIADGTAVPTSITFTVTDDVDLEHVGLRLDISGDIKADYEVLLISPDGTISTLARPNTSTAADASTDGWFYVSNQFWGEESTGDWTVEIRDFFTGGPGTLDYAQLEFYGGTPDTDDTYYFTEEFSEVGGTFDHFRKVEDTNGGIDAINAAAITSSSRIWLDQNDVTIDGRKITNTVGIENIFAGDGNDNLRGTNDDNTIDGGRGDDKIFGKKGDDTLIDGAGKDVLSGLQGADELIFELDGEKDKARGYEDNIDTLVIAGDSSLDFGDLTFVDIRAGLVRVKYSGETLVVVDDAGTLTSADLTATDFDFIA